MVTGALIGGFTQTNVQGYPYTKAHVTDNPVLPSAPASAGGPGAVGGAGNCTAGTGILPAKLTAATCTSDAGGLHVTAPLQQLVATGYAARRVINSAALCNNCHDQLGTNPDFHSGDRNDPAACNFCHYGNETDAGGWSADSSTWLHGIHGASKRTVPYTPVSTDYSTVLYPGLLKDCHQCHLPNTVNFGATGGAALQPNLLWSYSAIGIIAAAAPAAYAVSNPQLALLTNTTKTNSPYVTVGSSNYGSNFSYTVATGTSTAASATSLVNSPIASACFACHDTSAAQGHITTNGGILYGVRGAAATLVNNEACLVCHGQGAIEDAEVVHQQP
jgi:OmcA/MtrC family decaheme c-type cytochrome